MHESERDRFPFLDIKYYLSLVRDSNKFLLMLNDTLSNNKI